MQKGDSLPSYQVLIISRQIRAFPLVQVTEYRALINSSPASFACEESMTGCIAMLLVINRRRA